MKALLELLRRVRFASSNLENLGSSSTEAAWGFTRTKQAETLEYAEEAIDRHNLLLLVISGIEAYEAAHPPENEEDFEERSEAEFIVDALIGSRE